ncbi:hypothetical protein QUF75_00260 [Desulfococcaceae bacterium HSG7]|nr:hypothetical protein [Desulfococcaceae bacterium HSG7]
MRKHSQFFIIRCLLFCTLFTICYHVPTDNSVWAKSPFDCMECRTYLGDNDYLPDVIYTIPVWVHIILQSDGKTGDMPDARVHSQIDILNEDFRAIANTPGQEGFDTGIQFVLAGFDRHISDCAFGNLINTEEFPTTVRCLYGMEEDPERYLNIYTINADSVEGRSGIAIGPGYDDEYRYYDGVYVEYKFFGRNAPAPDAVHYNQGRTTTGLIGGYLGLRKIREVKVYEVPLRTWAKDEKCQNCCPDSYVICRGYVGDEEYDDRAVCADCTNLSAECLEEECACVEIECLSCATPDCYYNGDLICDTNDQATVFFDEPCPVNSISCGTPDAVDNYMNTTGDECKKRFTEEQTRRMRCVIEHWRPGVADTTGESVASTRVPVYRFYSNQLLTHFFTKNTNEKDTLISTFSDDVWRYEGVSWYVHQDSSSGAAPLYRFYSDHLKRHFYTISTNEKDSIIANFPVEMWRYEGVAWYVYETSQSGTLPVYRFYSDTLQSHLYTMDENEKNYIVANYPVEMWRYEGVAYYAYPSGY